MDSAREFGRFLQSRRARVSPESVGLPVLGRRRVQGLRREEVASLAGVSVVYYVRLEQGRATNPSDGVLDSLARVLRLDEAERMHLSDLARAPRTRATRSAVATVRPDLQRLLDAFGAVPAYVLGPSMDVLASNELAAALVVDLVAQAPGHGNVARHVFLDSAARELYPAWSDVADQTTGFLRFTTGRFPRDAQLAALVDELALKSEDFRRCWSARRVHEKTHGVKRIAHPDVGELTVAFETLVLPGDHGQALVTFTADAGSTSETALKLLGSTAAGERKAGPDETSRPRPSIRKGATRAASP